MDGEVDEGIPELPRRYLNLQDVKVVPERLEDFRKGYYAGRKGRRFTFRTEKCLHDSKTSIFLIETKKRRPYFKQFRVLHKSTV
jgi:hypothetical protein